MLGEYCLVYFFFLLGLLITVLLFIFSYFFILKEDSIEKSSVYECGFDPFDDTRKQFDIHYYLTAIMFIVFDLEFIYLFPWFMVSIKFDNFRFYVYIFFFFLLILGLVYELQTESLDWNRKNFDSDLDF